MSFEGFVMVTRNGHIKASKTIPKKNSCTCQLSSIPISYYYFFVFRLRELQKQNKFEYMIDLTALIKICRIDVNAVSTLCAIHVDTNLVHVYTYMYTCLHNTFISYITSEKSIVSIFTKSAYVCTCVDTNGRPQSRLYINTRVCIIYQQVTILNIKMFITLA